MSYHSNSGKWKKELQSVLAEKHEVNTYDIINAELECAALSLECCKEEKEKREASFREGEREKSQLLVELASIKEQVEKFRSSSSFQKEESDEGAEPVNELSRNSLPNLLCSMCSKEVLTTKDAASKGMHGIPEVLVGCEFMQSDGKSLDVNSDHLATQRLKSSMWQLHEELEKMKTKNTHFLKDRDFDPDFQVPQEELEQLQRMSLLSYGIYIYIAYKVLSPFLHISLEVSGNALERVLALEIEFVESLNAKNNSNIHFQSSFLKQHNDEKAVFKSFRGINALIKQMLEMKGRHAAVEAELREMHDRYSQLSLQFEEVEGEREKLAMMLKNVRL